MDYLILLIIFGVLAYVFRHKIAEILANLFDDDENRPA